MQLALLLPAMSSALVGSQIGRSAVVSRASGINMGGLDKIPTKNVWAAVANAGECKPGTINSGFKFGQEVAIVCGPGGELAGFTNKMPPFGQVRASPPSWLLCVGRRECLPLGWSRR